jgi:hypothetical protein
MAERTELDRAEFGCECVEQHELEIDLEYIIREGYLLAIQHDPGFYAKWTVTPLRDNSKPNEAAVVLLPCQGATIAEAVGKVVNKLLDYKRAYATAQELNA